MKDYCIRVTTGNKEVRAFLPQLKIWWKLPGVFTIRQRLQLQP